MFGDPNYDYRTFNFDSDFRLFQRKVDPLGGAYDPNLARLRAAGKKIIHYHGWADTALAPKGSIEYYKRVAAALQRHPGIEDFYRLFMAPGMGHCGGRPGPNAFGQFYGLDALTLDPQHDVVEAIVNWVENGKAPDKIIATKYNNDVVAVGNVLRTRPLCPYPQVAKYRGTGSTNEAANFTCAMPSDADAP